MDKLTDNPTGIAGRDSRITNNPVKQGMIPQNKLAFKP